MLDYIRIGCAVPAVQVADTKTNTQQICDYISKADAAGCDLVVFPELAITGYTCADLFFQENLLKATVLALKEIAAHTASHPAVTAVVGAPVVICGQMYNCGVVLSGGVIRGIVPKTYLPNYKEFYERRWFSSSQDLHCKNLSSRELGLEQEYSVPVGRDLLFTLGDGTVLGVEICEDLWTPMPPSTMLTINGAEVADLRTGEVIYRANIPWEQAVQIMTALDELPVIYDCYMDNDAFMTASMKERADEIISSPH